MFTNKNLFSNACKLVLCTVLLLTFTSCDDVFPSSNKFIITHSSSYGKNTKYMVKGIDGRTSFFFESDEFYRVGDTLRLSK
ncbi:hypothetical protein LXD69_07210 [Flavobacterium sediminilitoris]|uniref:Uncharacterized protein n=1 Tax=Flavobacterium sediminilitoris TaxID=2024526 RepID=A0ABY4HU98_9FLAO|nr:MULTISPECIES: hypothetical protein [Flavobacterium]UOX35299.1 hypothetical protein LXD69_07210 [Flavobacterium sediminilitoris]